MRDVICKRRMCVFVCQLEMQNAWHCLKDRVCVYVCVCTYREYGREAVNSGKCHPHTHTLLLPSRDGETDWTEINSGNLPAQRQWLPLSCLYFYLLFFLVLFLVLSNFLKIFALGPNLQSSDLFSQRSSTCLMWTVGWHCLVSAQWDQQEARDRKRERERLGEVWCL